MARLSIRADKLPAIRRAMGAFPAELQEQLGESLRAGMQIAKQKAVELAPKGRGPAKGVRLAKSIYVRTVRSRKGWSATLGASAVHARIREKGGTIRAKNGPYLVFTGREGHLVAVKQVTQRATPYLAPALRKSRDAIVRELRQGMTRSVQTIRRAGG